MLFYQEPDVEDRHRRGMLCRHRMGSVMMSVHDALQAWQQGEITTSRAKTLTGAADVLELYGLADACDVEIRLDLNETEAALVARVTDAIKRVSAAGSDP